MTRRLGEGPDDYLWVLDGWLLRGTGSRNVIDAAKLAGPEKLTRRDREAELILIEILLEFR